MYIPDLDDDKMLQQTPLLSVLLGFFGSAFMCSAGSFSLLSWV